MIKKSGASSWISLIGLLMLLFGIYSSARTIINLTFYDKYPTIGVGSMMSVFGMPSFGPREEDCNNSMSMPYYRSDGEPRKATEEEKKMEEQQKKMCVESVAYARKSAKVNDIGTSALFVFLGAGVLIGKKYF